MDEAPAVYILTTRKNTVLYTGVTGDLVRRIVCKSFISVFFSKEYGELGGLKSVDITIAQFIHIIIC